MSREPHGMTFSFAYIGNFFGGAATGATAKSIEYPSIVCQSPGEKSFKRASGNPRHNLLAIHTKITGMF
jgi:hypothetical protein